MPREFPISRLACGGEGVAIPAILRVAVRITSAAADPFDQRGTDAVAFNGEGVISVIDVHVLNGFQVACRTAGTPRRRGQGASTGPRMASHVSRTRLT